MGCLRTPIAFSILIICCGAAAPATQPDAIVYPALQKMVAKSQARVKELETQNETLIHENLGLKDEVEKLTPKHKTRAGGVPDDSLPHPDAIQTGMSLADVIDLAGLGNLVAVKKTTAMTSYVVYFWESPVGDIGARRVWGTITVRTDGAVAGIMPRPQP